MIYLQQSIWVSSSSYILQLISYQILFKLYSTDFQSIVNYIVNVKIDKKSPNILPNVKALRDKRSIYFIMDG